MSVSVTIVTLSVSLYLKYIWLSVSQCPVSVSVTIETLSVSPCIYVWLSVSLWPCECLCHYCGFVSVTGVTVNVTMCICLALSVTK